MSVKFNGTSLTSVKFIDKGIATTLDKVIFNGVTVFENWQKKTGKLGNMNEVGTYSGTSSSVALSKKISFGKTVRFSKISVRTKVVRSDIEGRLNGQVKIYGVKSNGASVLVATVNNQWSTSVVSSSSTSDEFVAVRYDCYVMDDIARSHSYEFECAIVEWYEKGGK